MSASRQVGKYKVVMQWKPLPAHAVGADWTVGMYRVIVRQPESRHNIDHEIIFIWREPSKAGYGYTAEELGLTNTSLGTKRAYDIILRKFCMTQRALRPNRTLYQDLCAELGV